MRQDGFECEACGSASVCIPHELMPNSEVRCSGCMRPLATWTEYRATIAALVADCRERPIADPLPR